MSPYDDSSLAARFWRTKSRIAWFIDCDEWQPVKRWDRIRHRVACWIDPT